MYRTPGSKMCSSQYQACQRESDSEGLGPTEVALLMYCYSCKGLICCSLQFHETKGLLRKEELLFHKQLLI